VALYKAIEDIHANCESAHTYFFMVGAGISNPPVPLARSMIEHFKRKVGSVESQPPMSPMGEYSWWFREAYPGREGRRRYIAKLVENKNLSSAALQLAHLVSSRTLTNLVVTTNFDDFVARSLALLGKNPDCLDDPLMDWRIQCDRKQNCQILHLHGSYRAYDLRCLEEDIKDRSARRIAELLSDHVPLVIGYSGWEDDSFMSALKIRLKRQGLPLNLYWFCYRASEIYSLPKWLTMNTDVCFVIPDAIGHGAPKQQRGTRCRSREASHLIGEISGESVLPAIDVIDSVSRRFAIGPLKLRVDLLGSVIRQLKAQLPPELLRETMPPIEEARKLWGALEERMTEVRHGMEQGRYSDSVLLGKRLAESGFLPLTQLQELQERSFTAALKLGESGPDDLAAYDLTAFIGDQIIGRRLSTDLPIRELIAKSLFNRGYRLSRLNRSAEAIEAYDVVVQRFEDDPEPTVQEQVLAAMHNKAVAFYALGNEDQEIETYRHGFERFGNSTDPRLREPLAAILNSLGFALLSKASRELASGLTDNAARLLVDARRHLLAALERNPENAVILGNLAYVEFLRGDSEISEILLSLATEIAGPAILSAALLDLDVLQGDDAFRAIIKKVREG
jgi:tetratricopeptide (TPR) repeat protein